MNPRSPAIRSFLALTLLTAMPAIAADTSSVSGAATELQPVTSFDSIEDEAERSQALFTEMAKVILHPRCVNCHPAGDQPLQGESGSLHEPPVWRGEGGEGAVGMQCSTCHTSHNFDSAGVPGAPHWSLAPLDSAWEGQTVGYVCRQIQDQERNGGMDHQDLINHMAEDPLVGWSWNPGGNRQPVPGTQEQFGELVKAWIATGAACPEGYSSDL